MRVLVFGPTGGTGRLLVERALEAGHSVTAFARAPSTIVSKPGLHIVTGSVLDAAAVEAVIPGHEAVLSTLGGRPWRTAPICGPAIRNIAAAMSKHGPRRIIVISTLGADDTRADVGWIARNVLFRFVLRNEVADKEAMERHLSATDLDWTVVRVGILTDGPARGIYRTADDHSIQGMGKIARADVAAFMVSQLTSEAWLRRRPVIVN
ncbi:SDR family oxidoreductase [Bradyrhizobium diazoefficiens]|nr:SDR family oxidoreductase [Bradyrhizobium diazoefficiens]MBR0847793.1 SDR family oxidoreductase [Bradyrhizobium diazoefficiens]